jgi:hypothetical protein
MMQLKYLFWRGPDTTYDRRPLTPEQLKEAAAAIRRKNGNDAAPTSLRNPLANAGIPVAAAQIIDAKFKALEDRIAELERTFAPAHLRDLERRG